MPLPGAYLCDACAGAGGVKETSSFLLLGLCRVLALCIFKGVSTPSHHTGDLNKFGARGWGDIIPGYSSPRSSIHLQHLPKLAPNPFPGARPTLARTSRGRRRQARCLKLGRISPRPLSPRADSQPEPMARHHAGGLRSHTAARPGRACGRGGVRLTRQLGKFTVGC